jgi:hypothetical protein
VVSLSKAARFVQKIFIFLCHTEARFSRALIARGGKMRLGTMDLLCGLLGAFFMSSPAAASICDNAPSPRVEVTRVFDAPKYDFSSNFEELDRLAERHDLEALNAEQVIGLSTSDTAMTARTTLWVGQVGAGPLCVVPSLVQVSFGFSDNVIHVAKELPRRSCPHSLVLAHEERHVATDRALLDEFAPKLEQLLKRALIGFDQRPFRSQDEGQAELELQIKRVTDPFVKRFESERSRRQAEIDTPAEYRRVYSACDGQIREIMLRYAQSSRRKMTSHALALRSAAGNAP